MVPLRSLVLSAVSPQVAMVFLMLCLSCVTQQYTAKGVPVVLGKGEGECSLESTEGRYYLLFGAVPIFAGDPPTLAPKPGRSFKITERAEPIDFAVTLLGGWLVTLTRRTVEIESCADDVLLTSRADVDKEINQKLDAYKKGLDDEVERATLQAAADGGREPTVILHSGNNVRGKIVEMDSEAITVAVESDDEDAEKIDRIHLKKGAALEGKIVNQNPKVLTLQMGNKSKMIQKADIIRSEIGVIPKKIEQRKIQRKEVKKIVLAEKS